MSRPLKKTAPVDGLTKPVIRLTAVVFTGAVGPDETQEFAFGQIEVKIADGLNTAEIFKKTGNSQDDGGLHESTSTQRSNWWYLRWTK